ncbi:hypothetical protein IC229_00815 [Spirosoma sp. BT702]|uniref:DUF4377 domain-containing protein n=1 Tax=Spirosoma profusum TaxID=2771354 RepID=A0A926XSU5_9BACT|nr:hypothetical protein [Spirosoma profusum]MBD2699157.1 hypothetical protein [Spirosoma profusum]
MKGLFAMLLLVSLSATAQTKPESAVPPAIVAVVETVSGKHFVPDTTFASFSEEDKSLLAKEPVANWSLLQESDNMAFSNLVVGTRSYQLVIRRLPKASYPTATVLRYTTPQSKPEPIVRGTLQAKEEAKAK